MRPYRLLLTLLTAFTLIVTFAAATTYEKNVSEQPALTGGAEGVASGDSASKEVTTTKGERGWGLAVVRVGIAVGKAVAKAVTVVVVVVLKTIVQVIFPGP